MTGTLGTYLGKDLERIFRDCGIRVETVDMPILCDNNMIYGNRIKVPSNAWDLDYIPQISIFGNIYNIKPTARINIEALSDAMQLIIDVVPNCIICEKQKEYELGDIDLVLEK